MTVTVVDARGLRCPLPVLRLRRAARPGLTIDLEADDPAAAVDVPAFAREMGWELEATGPLRWTVHVPGGEAGSGKARPVGRPGGRRPGFAESSDS